MESNLGDLRHGGIPRVYNGPFVSGTDIGPNIPPSRKLRYAIYYHPTSFPQYLMGNY